MLSRRWQLAAMARISWRNALPSILVGALILGALLLVADSRFRRGATLLSASLLLAAGMRLTMSADRLGPLVVRSRTFDVLFCAGLGGLLLWLVLIDS